MIHLRNRPLIAAALAFAATLAGATAAQAAPSAQARLASVAHRAPARQVVAIAQFKHDFSERGARALVRAHGAKITANLPVIHGLALKLPAREAAALGRNRHVLAIQLNNRVHNQGVDGGRLATTFPLSVGADRLWARGITGKGVGVAVIDSGVSGGAADFTRGDGTTRIAANVLANPGATRAGDDVGHGTHVAGIIAGNSLNRDPSDPNYGLYEGIAPEADLITIKTADDEGNSTVLDVIDGLQFVVDHRDDLHIGVVNLSLTSDTPSSYLDDPLDAAVEFAWHSGIVVVTAAGNRGNAADAVQYAPANDPYVVTVGGVDQNGTSAPADDTVADWSSHGTTLDGLAKPDVLAPGAHITSTLAPGGLFAQLCPQCLVGDGYFTMSGTSMAAPVVSGAAALVLQARPDYNPDQVKQVLDASARPTAAATGELAADLAVDLNPGKGANQGNVPNVAVAEALVAAGIDPTRATWTRASWTRASWTRASWTRASWTRATWTDAEWARATWTCAGCDAGGTQTESTRAQFTRSVWTTHPDW